MNTSIRRRTFSTLALTGALGLLAPAAMACNAKHHLAGISLASAGELPSPAAVTAALRDLWIGHAFHVRGVAQATVDANKAAAEASENATVANAKTIAASIYPYYGPDAGERCLSCSPVITSESSPS